LCKKTFFLRATIPDTAFTINWVRFPIHCASISSGMVDLKCFFLTIYQTHFRLRPHNKTLFPFTQHTFNLYVKTVQKQWSPLEICVFRVSFFNHFDRNHVMWSAAVVRCCFSVEIKRIGKNTHAILSEPSRQRSDRFVLLTRTPLICLHGTPSTDDEVVLTLCRVTIYEYACTTKIL